MRSHPDHIGHHATGPTHGADGDRTHDLRLAKPALSQLSYSPEGSLFAGRRAPAARRAGSKGLDGGLSSLPSCLRLHSGAGCRRPCLDAVLLWLEGTVYSLDSPADQVIAGWAQVESNYRPHPYQGCALAN